MQFSLMGPMCVTNAHGAVELRGTLRRTLLAVLLLHADTVVSNDQLVEHLWGEGIDLSSVSASLYNQITRLRHSLGDAGDRIRAVPPGYLIHVEPGELDLQVFTERREAGRRCLAAGECAAAEAEFAAALSLWRGEPLADLPSLAGHPLVQRVGEDRLQVEGGLVEARLNLGRHAEVLEDLEALVARYPLHQSFHGQLMLAHYRAGRRSAALDAYRSLERTLVDELGIEPSTELQDLHDRILRGDESLSRVPTAAAATAANPRRQLPADTRLFTGRVSEMDELFEFGASASGGAKAGATVISALNGMGGVGKSALAIHIAHRISGSFPDGQLYVDLHGHTTGMKPLGPLDALHQLLRSLGVPPEQISDDLAECGALYRAALAGTRTLIVLDDAAGADQVRPLLAAEPGCFTLITSRTALTGLDDARSITLDVLPEPDAVALLRKVAGPHRVPEDHPAVTELVQLCGLIPLGIRIVGARLRHQRNLRIEDLVARLRGESGRLENLRDEERNLSAVFDTSYEVLDEPQQRLFRLLSLVPGPDADIYAAANLIGSDLRTTERLLDALVEHSLVLIHAHGRYRLHDLLRVYARGRAEAGCAEDGEAAVNRLLDYYRRSALAADRQLTIRARPHLTGSIVGQADGVCPQFPDQAAASAWFTAELPSLVAAATMEGLDPARLIALTTALATFLSRRGPWPLAAQLHEAAASAAREAGDSLSEGAALLEWAQIRHASGQVQTAIETGEQALAVYRRVGDRHGIASALDLIADFLTATGDFERAMAQSEQALGLYRELGDKYGMATTLWSLGRIAQRVVDSRTGATLLKEALDIFVEIGSTQGEALISGELARGAYNEGRFSEAAELSRRAMSVFREVGHQQNECMATLDLSRILLALGRFEQASELQERGLNLSREIGFRFGEATAIDIRGELLAALGEHADAAEHLRESLAMSREMGDQYGEAALCRELGASVHALGDYSAAAELLGTALDIFREVDDVESEAFTLVRLGALEADTVGTRAALERYRQALEHLSGHNHPIVVAEACEGIARCLAADDPAAALNELRKSVALYRDMGAWQAERASSLLAELEASAASAASR
jgi:DNA-binding SARP family transcriptional activator/predicted negative regulator of RcsB-dependent stress response